MSSSNSPCAACKFLRRKCTPGCVFAPYFPPDQPVKFANVHKVFGASNVAKLLNELAPAQREDAVNSLAYEADARLRDPVYGCVGYISLLQHHLIQLQRDLSAAKKELSVYIGSAALGPFLPHHQFQTAASQPIMPGFVLPAAVGMGLEHGNHQSVTAMYRDNHQQQEMEARQLAEAVAAAREQEMLRSMEQQQEMGRLNAGGGFVRVGDGSDVVRAAAPGEASRPLAFVSPQMGGFEGSFLVQQQQQQLELQFQEAQHGHRLPHHQRRSGSDEGRSGAGPSS